MTEASAPGKRIKLAVAARGLGEPIGFVELHLVEEYFEAVRAGAEEPLQMLVTRAIEHAAVEPAVGDPPIAADVAKAQPLVLAHGTLVGRGDVEHHQLHAKVGEEEVEE